MMYLSVVLMMDWCGGVDDVPVCGDDVVTAEAGDDVTRW